MLAYRFENSLAVLAVVCVLIIFFFPSAHGPYPVVHGPVTALLSLRASAALRVRIVKSALITLAHCLRRSEFVLQRILGNTPAISEFRSDAGAAACPSILRC